MLWKMDLLEDLRMSLLSILVYNIFECFFKEFNRLFFTTYNEGNFKSGTKNNWSYKKSF